MTVTRRPCAKCGVDLVIAPTGAAKPDGSPVFMPLRKVRKVYVLSGEGVAEVVLASTDETFISHYEDCPAASSFSKKSKAKEAPE